MSRLAAILREEEVARWLGDDHGHHRFTLDPDLADERAIRSYATVGFRPVGIMWAYERGRGGTWHDNLLMDLLAQDPAPGSAAGALP